MKLYRFTAADSQKAAAKVGDALGPDALIYSTRKVADGIEILAGLSYGDDSADDLPGQNGISVQEAASSVEVINRLSDQLQVMQDNIQRLTGHIDLLNGVMHDISMKQKQKRQWKLLNYISLVRRTFKSLKEGTYEQQPVH